jgi:hypothetical protein
MRIFEFDTTNVGYYDPADDNYSVQKLHSTRKPVITLRHLNKLKKMRSAKTLENLVRRDLLAMMYGPPPAESGEMGGFSGM